MKILVDCSTAKMGGARTYLEQILRRWAESPNRGTWVVYGPPGCRSTLPAMPPPSIDLRELPPIHATPAGYLWWLQKVLPGIVRREAMDAVFSATGFGSLNPPRPQGILIRNPIYFSDLYESRVQNLGWKAELLARRWLSIRMIQKSQGVIFPTQAMWDLVARHVSLAGARCVVAPYGCDTEFFHQENPDAAWLPAQVHQARGQFLLNVSHYCAQKNLTVLFKALGILRRQGFLRPLVLTTRLTAAPNCSFREDQAILQQERLEEQVVQLGAVLRQRLPALYQAAGLFLFPSYVESFGHPLVEAMAAGLPIVAADTPVHREICQEAALYADPFEADVWADKILQGLNDEPLRQRLAQAGRTRARNFSWSRHTDTIAALCQELVGGKPS